MVEVRKKRRFEKGGGFSCMETGACKEKRKQKITFVEFGNVVYYDAEITNVAEKGMNKCHKQTILRGNSINTAEKFERDKEVSKRLQEKSGSSKTGFLCRVDGTEKC